MTLELGLIALATAIIFSALAGFVMARRRRVAMPPDFRLACVVNSIDAERTLIHGLEKSKIPYRAIPVKIENPSASRGNSSLNIQDRYHPIEIHVSEMNLNAAKTVLARINLKAD